MDVIEMARELGKAIQQDERYKRIDAAKKANDEDIQLQELIVKFKLKELYAEVMANPNMVEFNAAKGEVDVMMNFISEILYGSVNGENPDTIEMQTGCGGNCASCGGCH